MKKNNKKLNLSFAPMEMISSWKRTGLSSDFCTSIILSQYELTKQTQNILSSIINDLLELGIKIGEKKDATQTLSIERSLDETTLTLKTHLTQTAYTELKDLIKKINNLTATQLLTDKFFTQKLSELAVSIYNFFHISKGSFTLRGRSIKNNTIKSTIKLSLLNKEIH